MSEYVDLVIEWTGSDGEIRWEDWWVQSHGRQRRSLPEIDDLLGFIDYDLGDRGFPRLVRVDGRVTVPKVPADAVDEVTGIVEYHGFRVVSAR